MNEAESELLPPDIERLFDILDEAMDRLEADQAAEEKKRLDTEAEQQKAA